MSAEEVWDSLCTIKEHLKRLENKVSILRSFVSREGKKIINRWTASRVVLEKINSHISSMLLGI